MKYQQIKSLADAKSRRWTGVKKAASKKMTQLIREAEIKKKDERRASLV